LVASEGTQHVGMGDLCESRRLSVLTTGLADANEIPIEHMLHQAYPNPFNPSTTIRYGLPARTHVTLAVFNMLGQHVAMLVEVEQEAGYHEVKFDARNLPSGVYFYRIQAWSYVKTKRLLLLKVRRQADVNAAQREAICSKRSRTTANSSGFTGLLR
jgi:hypothetical protein